MRLMFINNAHPYTPHVSGMRLFFFARAMSRFGHQVLLLTDEDPTGVTSPLRPGCGIADAISSHNWSEPFVLAVPATSMWSTEAARHGRLPIFLRKVVTAWHFIAHGGVFPDWTLAVERRLSEVLGAFSPELVWATFGNTSNLALAQAVARAVRCPWIADIKDNWETFVPAPLRQYMAWRFRDAIALSANAEHHLAIARRWHEQEMAEIVYSGVADCLFDDASGIPSTDGRYLLLLGATYSESVLDDYLLGVRQWLGNAAPAVRTEFRIRYAGSDEALVRRAILRAGLEGISQVDGQLPLDRMARLAKGAFACSYLWAPFTFHHKLLELLVAGRAVIAFPGEHDESRCLAKGISTPFYVCSDQDALCAALQASWLSDVAEGGRQRVAPAWRWGDFAEDLEALFLRCAAPTRLIE